MNAYEHLYDNNRVYINVSTRIQIGYDVISSIINTFCCKDFKLFISIFLETNVTLSRKVDTTHKGLPAPIINKVTKGKI